MVRVIAALLALALAGCGEWVKPGISEQERARDNYECERDAKTANGPVRGGVGGAAALGIADAEMKMQCLRSKGYVFTRG